MENTHAYRLWQSGFVEKKFAPVLAHNDLLRVRRVLDVACGPGTNANHFAGKDYLGIDRNAGCIQYARQHHRGNFVVADAISYRCSPGESFDFILINSFLHHVDSVNARRILCHLSTLLAEDGHVHILDLVLPERRSIARLLAHLDRGEFPRPVKEWLDIVTSIFNPVVFQPYTLTAFGVTLWNMVYFKGKVRR
jgi:SAM-dependent methyltransferase